ncbi:matrix remodeling-associated protein 8-like [Electrophorus electricus]|uniref:matrix remodeling-associated protein 8-like n=1 Tax=Electrophorus electricus TaxID=8005 RepID=UPI0015D0127B|nr:matrix remodeling-associated protein 8-like [Electrophorus electricus]
MSEWVTTSQTLTTSALCTDDATLIGVTSNDDESVYREEATCLMSWCANQTVDIDVRKKSTLLPSLEIHSHQNLKNSPSSYWSLCVQGPSGPLVAQLGHSVLLLYFTQVPLPLEWRKTDSESLVNIFQHRENRPELQSQSFSGRAHFFPDEILKGNFSILLRNVERKDAGIYRCKVNTIKESRQVLVEIEDAERLVVTGADRAVVASVGEEVILNCSVDSHLPANKIEQVSWRRTDGDIPVLLFQDNETFPESSHERYQGRTEFFITEIPKGNFSLKLRNVKMEDKGEFMCEVHTSDKSGYAIVVLQRIVYTKTVMQIHASLVLCPNACMFAASILLSNKTELTAA